MHIFVFAHHQADFENCQSNLRLGPEVAITWIDSSRSGRLSAAWQQPNEWALFLDADCVIEEPVFRYLQAKTKEMPSNKVIVGTYINPPTANRWQRCHNLIANAWLRNRLQTEKKPALLGGAFLLRLAPKLKNLDADKKFWGAEDKKLAIDLCEMGYDIQWDSAFQIEHHTSSRAWPFLKRAWLHGVRDVTHLQEKFKFQIPFRYWDELRNIEKSDWPLVPLVALHFLVQKTAKLTQTIRRRRMWLGLRKTPRKPN